jgi:hypothetical protein
LCHCKGWESIDPLEDAENSSLEFLRRRCVSCNPIYLFSVWPQKKEERSAADVESFVQFFAERSSPLSPKKDEILIQKLGEPGLFIKLLDQQLTVASTVFLEKIEKEEFTRVLCFGLGVLERSHLPILA